MTKYLFLLFFIFLLVSCNHKRSSEEQINVFCASSLFPVIENIRIQWENEHSEKVIINAASSGTLARQIENGASADIFISANQEWMNSLISSTKLESQPKIIASNQLVVVVPLSSQMDSMDYTFFINSLPNSTHHIAVGDPGHVPLGKYTKQAMTHYNADLATSKLNFTKDARSALRLVELGEVDIGFVYLSDALTSTKVRIVSQVPQNRHDLITYQAILINVNQSNKELINYITSPNTHNIWEKYGFKKL